MSNCLDYTGNLKNLQKQLDDAGVKLDLSMYAGATFDQISCVVNSALHNKKCVEEVKKMTAGKLYGENFDEIHEMAMNKLRGIIKRFGDSNGERRKPYYMAAIMIECAEHRYQSRLLKEKNTAEYSISHLNLNANRR